jgi:hypothetical protein
MFKLPDILALLPVVGPLIGKLPEFVAVFDQIVGTFNEDDQAILKDAYEDLMAENDAGHARLQAKLAAARLGT